MIDIIIPAYNNHSTIEQSLCSLAMQINKDDLQVIISNDGGADYQEIIKIFSRWLNIKEIKCPFNQGPGFARNYGLENSNSEYVMFMDADDTFISSYAISEIQNLIKENSNICFVMSNALELCQTEDKKILTQQIEPNFTFLFGHMYRRSFLEKYNIRFQTSCFTEDSGFNTLCALYARKESKEEGIAIYANIPTYAWTWSKNSFSRNVGDSYGELFCIPGHIYNQIAILNHLEKNNLDLQEYMGFLVAVLFTIYTQYNFILTQKDFTDKTSLSLYTEELGRYFFYKYYNLIMQSISLEEYHQKYQETIYTIQNQQEKPIQLTMSLEDFTNFMFSKPVKEDLNYLEFEQKLLHQKQPKGESNK